MHVASGTERRHIRILIVDEAIAFGGVERMWSELVPELARLVDRVIWLLPEHRINAFGDAVSDSRNVRCETHHRERFSFSKVIDGIIRRLSCVLTKAGSEHVRSWIEDRRLREIIRREGITHIVYPALFQQRFPCVPLPVSASVMDTNYHPSWRGRCEDNLRTWAQNAHSLITISSFTKDEVNALTGSNTAARIHSVPIAVKRPTCKLQQADFGRELPYSLYFPGSFNPHKGHGVLLKALRLLHEGNIPIEMVFTGGGLEPITADKELPIHELETARKELQAFPKDLRDRIRIKGFVDSGQVEESYRNATVVVLPSAYEGFGLPLAEAIGRGKRVICSDIPAFREQVELYGFGAAVTFVPVGEPAAFAAAIRQELEAKTAFPYSQQELDELFDRWTWRMVAADYLAALDGV